MKVFRNMVLWLFGTSFSLSAYASEDPFALAKEKTTQLTDYLTGGGLIPAICTLVIIVAILLYLFDKIRATWFIRIFVAAIVIGTAAGISAFLFSGK